MVTGPPPLCEFDSDDGSADDDDGGSSTDSEGEFRSTVKSNKFVDYERTNLLKYQSVVITG